MTFFMAAIFMILVFWRPQEWLAPWLQEVPLLDIVVFAALLGLILELGQKRARLPKGPVPYLIAGLWFASMMSHVAHAYFQGLMDTIPETGKVCFFTLLLLVVIDRSSRARAVAAIFVGAACLMAIHALLQDLTGTGFAHAEPIYTADAKTGAPIVRTLFFGIFSDPNDLAQLLATSMPLAFAIPKRMNVFSFLTSTGVVALLMMAFLTTHSRGGQIALIAVCVTLVLLRLPARWLPYAMLLVLGGAMVVVALKGGAMLDESAQQRVEFWGLANRAFLHNPVFGIGFGMFGQVADDRAAHNAFVHCYTELGIFGYWFWFGLIALGVTGCWRSRVALMGLRNPDQVCLRRFAGLSLAAMVGFTTSAYFLSRAWVYPLFFLMALLNAVPSMVEELLPQKAHALINMRGDLAWVCTVGALLSIVYIYVTILLLNHALYGG